MHADLQQGDDGTDEVVALAVEVLRVLADPCRLALAMTLLDGERSVRELSAAVGRPGPGVSQHLAKMRMARLVATRKHGTTVLYRIENEHVRQLVIDSLRHVEHLRDHIPAHHRPSEVSR